MMKMPALLCFALLAVLLPAQDMLSQEASNSDPEPAHKVLLLHSYSEGNAWTRSMDRAIRRILSESGASSLIFTEHMDSKRYDFSRYAESFRGLIRSKYDTESFSVVVVTDDNAANFAAENREELFGGTPLVFAGANTYDKAFLNRLMPATGVAEQPDFAGTIAVATRLHPKTTTLVSVSDVTTTGKLNQRRFDAAVADLDGDYEVRRLAGLTAPALRTALGELPRNSLVFHLSVFRTADGRTFSTREGAAFVADSTRAPVYSSWDFSITEGVVGGLVVNGDAQGSFAANLALRILSGEAAAQIPVVEESPNRYVFDYQAMRRFGIRRSELPDGSILLNEPEAMWYRYGRAFAIGVGIIVLLAAGVVTLLINILLRRQAQQRLTQSQDRYRRVFWNLQDVYIEVAAATGRITEVSPSVARLGYERDELLDTPVEDLFLSSHDWRDVVSRAHNSRDDLTVDHECRVRAGTRRESEEGESVPVAVSARYSTHRDTPYVVATIRDISERWRKDNELRRLYRAVEVAGHAIYITDTDGTIQYVNAAFEEITGFPRNEAIGSTPRLFKSGRMPSRYYERLWNTILSGETWSEEIINARKDGAIYVALQTITAVADESGSLRWFVAVQTDKTEQKEIEEALGESERQYRLLAEHATDMISRHRPDGRYIYASPACRSLLGYDPDDLVDVDAYSLFHPEDLEAVSSSHTTIQHGVNVVFVTYRIRRKDDSYVWVETTSKTVLDETSGEISEIVAITRDASRRVAMEEDLRRAKREAEEASAAKSSFLANVSHEIRTPLNAIIGLGELIDKRIEDPTARRYLETVRNSSQTLLQLINDILDLSKVEARQLDIHLDYVTVGKLVTEVGHMFEVQLQGKDVGLGIDVDAVNDLEVRTDPHRLRQILINLVGNAVKFTRSGEIRLAAAAETTPENQATVTLSVEDTGIGIPTSKLEAIFDAFAQADSSASREFGGTGLGLTISRNIVTLLGGTISVESKEDVGSTFTVRLPDLPCYRRPRPLEEYEEASAPLKAHRAQERFGLGDVPAETRRALRTTLTERIDLPVNELRRLRRFDELSRLARTVTEVAKEYGVAPLEAAGEALQQAAEEFDVGNVERTLERIEQFFRELGVLELSDTTQEDE
ncbi:MAG: PAS domain S-box protein [Spirochaetes bacterium]|jgi:PAS domain S-box-containing protein|nr:PAS domain S-box protein [Spirochaetota bacterium]